MMQYFIKKQFLPKYGMDLKHFFVKSKIKNVVKSRHALIFNGRNWSEKKSKYDEKDLTFEMNIDIIILLLEKGYIY